MNEPGKAACAVLVVIWLGVLVFTLGAAPTKSPPNAPTKSAPDDTRRSPKWPAVRDAYFKLHPACEVCGEDDPKLIQIHHAIPYHVDRSKELDSENLISLCTGSTNCHLMFGHLKNFKSWNVDVKKDAALWRAKIRNRPMLEKAK